MTEWRIGNIRLIDLSKRNRLLFYRRTKRGNLSITSPSADEVFQKLFLNNKRIDVFLPPEEDDDENGANIKSTWTIRPPPSMLASAGVKRKDLEKTLKNLSSRSLSDYRERGVRILHAAFGMLVWKEMENSEEVSSTPPPCPNKLNRESIQHPFGISIPLVDEEVMLNPALQVKMKQDFNIDLPTLPEDWENQSLQSYFYTVQKCLNKFKWQVEPTLEIGLFSFHKASHLQGFRRELQYTIQA